MWFHGKMNEYVGTKQLYHEKKEQAVERLNFFETFEKELINETQ